MANEITKIGSFLDPFEIGPRRVEKLKKEQEKAKEIKSDMKSDAAQFEKFKGQEDSLLSSSTSVFNPKYKRASAGLKNQTEALAQIFNARKQEALSRKAAPGISQTRMM